MSASLEISRVAGDELDEVLATLLPVEPELPYANFLPIADRPGAAVRLHTGRWRETHGRIGAWVARDAAGAALAAVYADTRPFESEHFGLHAARLEQPIGCTDPQRRVDALLALYPTVLNELRQGGYQHVAARGSTRDRAAGWAIQAAGFFHVDTQVSWMCPLTGTQHDESLPPGLSVEVHERDTLPSVDPSRWRELADWAADAFDRGPYVFDLSLPYDRSRAIYRVWTERMMAGEWADAVILVFHGDKAVAFISMLDLPDVSAAAGVHVCGRGLGATLPGYRGLFTAIQKEMIARRPRGAAFMENETQVATIGSINVYAKLGFRYLRSTATYHRRLGND